ncbi:hypothetical protein N7G274_009949 [Stereocaulon virgatum]|uniref:Uncharacterized protein n=1 Tax=Stereocaulon virgatum TaxID=373712 RepID=A0ABR3ZWY0_9LECA
MSRRQESYEQLHSHLRKKAPSRDGAKKHRDSEQREEEKRRKKSGRNIEGDYSDPEYEESSGRDPARRNGLKQFFLDGDGIHREVLQMEICKYLGPEAVSRPYNHEGIEGYRLNAIRTFTQEEIDELRMLSDAFKSELRYKKRNRVKDISYGVSETRDHQESILRTMSVPQTGYQSLSSLSSPTYQPAQGGAYPGYPYSQAPGYFPVAAYPSPLPYSGAGQPVANDPNTYNEPYVNPGRSIGYPPIGGQYPQYPPRDLKGLRTESNAYSSYVHDVNAPLNHSSTGNYSEYSAASPPLGRGTSYDPSYESSYDPSYDPSNEFQENVYTGTGRTFR